MSSFKSWQKECGRKSEREERERGREREKGREREREGERDKKVLIVLNVKKIWRARN